MKKTAALKDALDAVEAHCKQWNTQYTYYHPQEIERRRVSALRASELVRALLGIFVYPTFRDSSQIFLFEGLRNAQYMSAFDRRCVFVIGSHQERAFAARHGYGFVWSFPIDAAVRARIYRRMNFFAYIQLAIWRRALSRRKNVVFYLYEDTQPIGTFFVHASRSVLHNATTVCIQHGYFSALKQALRYEGELSDINFLWDQKQVELMGLNPAKSFVIGLPYVVTAAAGDSLSVVLVGDGAPHGDPYAYISVVNAFHEISRIAEDELKMVVVYRPHPNESAHVEVLDSLRKRFKLIDSLGKVERLGATRSIYVGTVSSLLYEAKQAGHYVVSIRIQDKESPVFDADLTLRPQELRSFASWARELMQQRPVAPEKIGTGDSPLARFRDAVVEAKLPLC